MKRVGKHLLFGVAAFSLILVAYGQASCASFKRGGYWENWVGPLNPGSGSKSDASYYQNDLRYFNYVYYSFLTLAQRPDPYSPPDAQWDGKALYESMTQADVIEVMTVTDPPSSNPNEWQRTTIQAIIDACHANGKKFIWAVGGWSDLTRTIGDDQIPALVDYCVRLLKLSGDGLDFDWEHLSDHADIAAQQRAVLGKFFPALRKALDDNGLADKVIGYTTRFNAFWDNATRPAGVSTFVSDGEGLDAAAAMAGLGSSIDACLDWVNIMMYDVAPSDLGASGAFSLATYKLVLNAFQGSMQKSRIVMGFEPGGQVSGGVWEGMTVDKQVIDYLKAQEYGGIMFWAINQPASPPDTQVTGQNAQDLAKYASVTRVERVRRPLPGVRMLLLDGS